MRLTVHIGTTKTGSTSIQAFLRANRAALLQRGILVPESLGESHHLRAVLSSLPFGASPDLARHARIQTEADLQAYRTETMQAYAEELRKAPDAAEILITSEHLHSRLEESASIRSFRDLFCPDGAQTRIIVYVRPQLDHAGSLYSTMLRHGFSGTLDDFLKSRSAARFRPYFDLESVLARWSAVFGEHSLEVRPYKGLPPADKGGVVADFCDLLGIDPNAADLLRPADTNSSINPQGQELLRRYNSAMQNRQAPQSVLDAWIAEHSPGLAQADVLHQIVQAPNLTDAARRARLVRWVEAHCSGKGAEASLAQAQAFQARFAAGNAAVIARHFPNHPEYLEPRWPRA